MKGILTKLMSVVVCMAMMVPVAEAQHRPGSNGGRTSRPAQQARPQGNHSRPASSSPRPGNGNSNRPNNSGQGTRPGNGNNHRPATGNSNNNRPNTGNHGTRPGSSGNNNQRPNNGSGGNLRPGNGNTHRPDNGNNDNFRPGNGNYRPGGNGNHRPDPGRPDGVRPGFNHNNRPDNGHGPNDGYRPGNNHGPNIVHRPGQGPRPPYMAPPSRPYRPSGFRGPFSRPLPPPPGWRPRPGIPVINGILGLTFGAGIGISLDYLFNNGYTVDGYGNDMIYLRNVPALNYMWTDATLYYGNGGGFDGSSFYYSTPYYDLGRYNAVYNTLVSTYGMPVAVNNGAGTFLSTWYGGNNGFITLRFNAQATVGGSVRYFTTLSFGN